MLRVYATILSCPIRPLRAFLNYEANRTRLHLERAKCRMVETDAAMKDVTIDAGFHNSDHF